MPAASSTRLEQRDGFWLGRFRAMASPCEVLVDASEESTARAVLDAVAAEAWRVDEKFSRYRPDNVVHAVNTSHGMPITVDEETADILDFCTSLHTFSDGLFDITCGVLRRVWTFDGGAHVPAPADVEALRSLVGWDKVTWHRPTLVM